MTWLGKTLEISVLRVLTPSLPISVFVESLQIPAGRSLVIDMA